MPAGRSSPRIWILAGLLLVRGTEVGASLPLPITPGASSTESRQEPGSGTPSQEIQRLLAESSEAYQKSEPARGRVLAESALKLATQQALPGLEAEARYRLGRDDAWFRRHAGAREQFERARVLFQQVGDRSRDATVAVHLAVTLRALDEEPRAIEMLLSARTVLLELREHQMLAYADQQLMYIMPGSAAKDRLRDEVIAELRAARQIAAECNVRHEWGDELFNAGRYAESHARLIESLRCYEQTDSPAQLGRLLVSLGRVERVHGQLEKALGFYKRALALQQGTSDKVAAIQSLNAMAVTLQMLGRPDEARPRFEEALALARELGTPRVINFVQGNFGGAHIEWGRYQDAVALLEPARAQETGTLLRAVRTRQLSSAYQGVGRSAEALALADEAVALATSLGPEEQLYARWNRAAIAHAQGRLELASRDLADAVRIVDDLRAHTLPADFMRRGFGERHQELYSTGIDILIARKDGRGALAVSEQARSRAFLDRLAARNAARAEAPDIAAPVATGSADRPAQPKVDVAAATSAPASLADIQALARRLRSTWVMFWVGPTATTAWVVRPDGAVHWTRIPIQASALAALVAQSVPPADGVDALASVALGSRAHLRPWRELHRVLWKPIQGYLPAAAASRLTIVPHGPLFRLSFAALQDERGRYLLEQYDLHYVPAAGVLQFTSAAGRHAGPRAQGTLLVGDPGPAATPDAASRSGSGSGSSSGNGSGNGNEGRSSAGDSSSLPALGWARREVSSIAKLLPGQSDMLVGDDATEGAIRRRLAGRRVIHFATHGVVHNDETLASYLAVHGTGAGTATNTSTEADGRLTSDEIDDLRLDADLVVLSACSTALGPISGDGVQGFTRAFLSAGADSVIATTWSVADRTSYQVMEGFYRAWSATPAPAAAGRARSKSGALRQAQLAMLRELRKGGVMQDDVVLHESPWLWAGFVLVGNP